MVEYKWYEEGGKRNGFIKIEGIGGKYSAEKVLRVYETTHQKKIGPVKVLETRSDIGIDNLGMAIKTAIQSYRAVVVKVLS